MVPLTFSPSGPTKVTVPPPSGWSLYLTRPVTVRAGLVSLLPQPKTARVRSDSAASPAARQRRGVVIRPPRLIRSGGGTGARTPGPGGCRRGPRSVDLGCGAAVEVPEVG